MTTGDHPIPLVAYWLIVLSPFIAFAVFLLATFVAVLIAQFGNWVDRRIEAREKKGS